jgi:hypothetical protein
MRWFVPATIRLEAEGASQAGVALVVATESRSDGATEYDIGQRSFKKEWPHYIRVHHAEFVTGDMANGVSLNQLMDSLGSDAFASTQRHATEGAGNTNPRHAYQQQAAVELTREGQAWLNERLEQAFEQHGRIGAATLQGLDWPVDRVSSR